MDLAGDRYAPNSVEAVFRDFKSRRAALARALTTDVASFYQQCDPERENLCLYGFPNEKWEVNLPAEEVPPELPEPALGINFARDGMAEKDWLSLVSVHSDSWLMSVAFFFAARYGLDKNDRKRLFALINDLPTLYEVVNGNNQTTVAVTSHSGSKSTVTSHSGSKSKTNSKVPRPSENPIPAKYTKVVKPKEEEEEEEDENEDAEEEEEDEREDTLCGACGENYATDEFWICCDLCEKWFHGRCVKITPAKAEHIKQYKCPSCTSNKRTRA